MAAVAVASVALHTLASFALASALDDAQVVVPLGFFGHVVLIVLGLPLAQ